MKKTFRTGCTTLLTMLVFRGIAFAQSQQFDINAYKSFLSAHKNMTASQVLTEYPTPLLRKNISPAKNIAFLDSIILKYKLTKDEQDLLASNGFMATERCSAYSFQDLYNDVWTKDLPMCITTDAILHALHLSYDDILKETESWILVMELESALDDMHLKALPTLVARYGNQPAMRAELQDVDVYLTIARSLLQRYPATPFFTDNAAFISQLMSLVQAEQPADVLLFSSTPRTYDFSQFTKRGHYTDENYPFLGGYFQSMMWLGRTEFMLTKPVQQGAPQQTDEDIQRQIIDAYLINEAVQMNSTAAKLKSMDSLISFFTGESDNVTPDNLTLLASESGITSADQLLDTDALIRFSHKLATKPFANQRINSQILMSDPSVPDQAKPPSAFLLMGQRFLIDSYVFSNVVYDKIERDGHKILRMLPDPLDALFALGNNAAGQLLQDQLTQYFYAPNLTGLRYLVDSYDESFWNASLYNVWLNGIRTLNAPDDVTTYPGFMQTAAWWQQKMNTQLASWAELRHDNLLYAKESGSMSWGCSYPEAYVEPYPEFYKKLSGFARKGFEQYNRMTGIKRTSHYFSRMAEIMDTLGNIAGAELAGRPLTPQETSFMKRVLYNKGNDCGGAPILDGWYIADLIYDRNAGMFESVIADVHTAPSDEQGNTVGWVMHTGTGAINLGVVIAPSQNGDLCAYVAPMMSFYEYTTTNFKRLTDEEWNVMLYKQTFPRPVWVNNYLADNTGARRPAGPSLLTIVSGVEAQSSAVAMGPALAQNYPNPFSSDASTVIGFTIPSGKDRSVRLEVFDESGALVRLLLENHLPPGNYLSRWDGRSKAGVRVAAGTYYCRLTSETTIDMKAIIVQK